MAEPTVLITGACGLLGAHLMIALGRDREVVGVDRHPWWGDESRHIIQGDLESPEFLRRLATDVHPGIVIHCAAMTTVDACELDPERAEASNAGVTRELIRAMPPTCRMVYISTDGVFQGDRPFWGEDDPPIPCTAYGRSKLHGEHVVAQATTNHLVIRTNFYGWSSGRKRTMGEWLYRSLKTHEPITLFDDVFFTPIYVVDLVERLIRLLAPPHQGIVHIDGAERLSKYAFGMLLADVAGVPADGVRRGTVEDAALVASRPKDTSLACKRFERLTGIPVPGSRMGLGRFIADCGRPLSARFEQVESLRNG